MKKILSLLLITAILVLTLASCSAPAGLNEVISCYNNSKPTKVEVTSIQQLASTFTRKITITSGAVNGKAAAIMTDVGTEFRTIEEGSGDYVYGATVDINETTWYQEEKGISKDGGRTWTEGETISPERGAIAMDLSDYSVIKNSKFENNVLTFTVLNADIRKVFTEIDETNIGGDATVSIKIANAVVTYVQIDWVIAANSEAGTPEIGVTITASYEYGMQEINM